MKQRVLSGIAMFLICAWPIYHGGITLYLLIGFIGAAAAYEFVKVKEGRVAFEYLLPLLLYLLAAGLFADKLPAIISIYLFFLFVLSLWKEDFTLSDLSQYFMFAFVLSMAGESVQQLYQLNNFLMIYLILATFLCDIFALFTGMAFGKHKLNPRISPKKTIEGSIGGWLFGAVFSFLFAYFFHFFELTKLLIIASSVCLPLVSQIGDLAFSLIKRTYSAKDFGKLIPGHGGVLDRCDSLIFSLLVFRVLLVIFG